jgi:hypothetical protein
VKAGLLALAAALMPAAAMAQAVPSDLTMLPPVPTTYTPKKTAWGDPDLRARFSLDNVGRVPFERPDSAGNRVWLTDEEFAQRLDAAKRSDAAFSADNTRGTKGLAEWMQAEPFARRSSMLVSPANGKLPPLRPEAEALRKAGRSSWVPNGTYDWVDDFDTWDRCISRGFPASMMPFRYNNGVRIFQSPGFVAIHFEMLGDRVIPLRRGDHWPAAVESWMGSSLGHWEGNTLVVETTNIKSGDDTTRDVPRRAASPLNVATGVQSNNAIPVSPEAKALERFTPTSPNALVYELTYSDPQVFTDPWRTRVTWTRDDSYQFFEYACHEGNVSIRNYVVASRTARGLPVPRKTAEAAGE